MTTVLSKSLTLKDASFFGCLGCGSGGANMTCYEISSQDASIFILHQQSGFYMKAVIFRLRLLVWPQEVAEVANGNVRKIIGKNSGFVNF